MFWQVDSPIRQTCLWLSDSFGLQHNCENPVFLDLLRFKFLKTVIHSIWDMSREYPIQQSCIMASHSLWCVTLMICYPYDMLPLWCVTLMSTSLEQHFVAHGSVLDLQSQDICFFLKVLCITIDIFEKVEKKVTSKYTAFLSITIIQILSEDFKGLRKLIFPPLFQLN